MRKKGFTLVELLVVIAIIALLMGILMPALARVRQIAYRMVCGTNLSGIGKAVLLYANDNDEDFPKAGGKPSKNVPYVPWSTRGELTTWNAEPDEKPYGRPPRATITSCWYLLIKYSDLTPKQFVCKGDVGAKIFKLSDYTNHDPDDEIEDYFDFGNVQMDTPYIPGEYCSYAMHNPMDNMAEEHFGYPITATSDPASPFAADRNLHLDKNAKPYRHGGQECNGDEDEVAPEWVEDSDIGDYYADVDLTGNSACHQREGQNVMFQDMHVNFERYVNCGIANDNIYVQWEDYDIVPTDPREVQVGDICPEYGNGEVDPKSEKDACLVSEWNDRDET